MSTIIPPLFLSGLRSWIRAQGLLDGGERVVVGTSSGADSTALAVLLAVFRPEGAPLDLHLVYVDHGWREPLEIDADFAHVQALATRLGGRAHRSPPPAPETPKTEAAARRHRYHHLARIAAQVGATRIALGHHAADQAETFLMRLLRGSGPVGLAGMRPARQLGQTDITIIRPLLRVGPTALRVWLKAEQIPWREDPDNATADRDRNRIRARLAAHTARRGGTVDTLNALCDRVRARLERREQRIHVALDRSLRRYPWAGAVSLPRAWLAGLARPLDLQLALRRAGAELPVAVGSTERGVWLTRRLVQVIGERLDGGGALDLPQTLRLHVGGHRVWLANREVPLRALPAPHINHSRAVPNPNWSASPDAAIALDADVLGDSSKFRHLQPEDTFVPFGSTSGRAVNVRAWLAKQGYPGFVRRGLPILVGAAGVACVVGVSIDRGHRVTPSTRIVAGVQLPLGPASP